MEKNPIPWPKEQAIESASADAAQRAAPTEEREALGPEYVREI
jgi:hypothetical protein